MVHALILACCFVPNPLASPRRMGVLNLALAAADYESAHAVQGPRGCAETNPLFTSAHPRRATFYARGLPVDFAIEAFGWYLNRSVPRKLWIHRVWKYPFLAVTYSHATGLYSNLTCK